MSGDEFHRLAYDSLNRQTLSTNPLNQTSTMAYNKVSLLTSQTDALGRRIELPADVDPSDLTQPEIQHLIARADPKDAGYYWESHVATNTLAETSIGVAPLGLHAL